MGSVSVQGAVKRYGALEVLHQINLDVDEGEFVVLVGPSGCGKSTLLRMIAGLEAITSGTISIGSTVVNDLPPKERNIAMVFQNYALYPHMKVRDNMAFSLRQARRPKEEIRTLVDRASKILDLDALLDRLPKALSGGQRQRVAMGRAIVRDPSVFLFDEPLSNLDAKLRVAMRAEIKSLHQRLKTTTVYVTHDQIEAMTLADRIVVMRDGHMEQIGSPLELYDTPANIFVATFIGSPSMNLIEGTIDVSEQGPAFRMADGYLWPLPVGVQVGSGDRVTYGVRPENLQITETGTPATVEVVEPTGAETHVLLRTSNAQLVAIDRNRLDIHPGDTVHISPDVQKDHLFDTKTGLRLVPTALQ